MVARIRSLDWSSTPLGLPSGWPLSLRTAVDIMLCARQPAFILWGADGIVLYNDDCIPLMRDCHPDALGRLATHSRSDLFAKLREHYEIVLSGGLPVHLIQSLLRTEEDGVPQEACYSTQLSPLFDECGGASGAYCTLQEESQIADVASPYRGGQVSALLHQAPLGIFLVDEDFRIREVNLVALAAFGDVPGGVVGSAFRQIAHALWGPELTDETLRIFEHTLQTGESYGIRDRAEFRIDRGVTEFYEWHVDRILLPEGRYGLVCYFRDITAEVMDRAVFVASEEQRRRAAKGLRAIAARARCLLWYADVEDRGGPALHWVVRMADEEAARRFLPVDVPPGHTYAMALAEARLPEDRTKMFWGDQETRAGRSYRQEFRVRDARGNIRWMAEDVQIEAIGPKQWNAVGICIDITESKQVEEEREAHRAEIEILNQRLRRAMAETHHRVKNNLQVVSALVDIQSMIHDTDVPTSELVRIGQHVRSLAAIHDLLTHDAKSNSTSDSILTKAVMDKLAPLLRSVVGERSIRFEVEDMALAQKQGTSLAVLVNELVSNAVKHGSGEIEVSIAVVEDRARLAVSDEGPGFSSEFDPVVARNTGLELIESVGRHDLLGTITYENRPEGGARVVVDFPRPMRTEVKPSSI
jgi:PAS domain S-box-containing protein